MIEPEPIGKFTQFFLFCSGVSLDLIKKCPKFEINKYSSIGLTVLFTTGVAILSSFYAFSLIFESKITALILGVVWGAIIFNLDGVITKTAEVHALAWKKMFDEYLMDRAQKTGEAFQEFSYTKDYLPFVDGKPRYNGVRDFLTSRNIELEFGDPEDLTGIAGGTYTVVVKDANGCEDTESIIVDSQAGIEDESSSLLTVYPNPTTGSVRIDLPKASINSTTIRVMDVLGKQVFNTIASTTTIDLDLSVLSSGVYFVNVGDNKSIKVVKL